MKFFLFRQSCYFHFFGGGVAGVGGFGVGFTLVALPRPSFMLTIRMLGDEVSLVILLSFIF